MKFSIIIPVYNVAQYLRECLDSVKAQTYTDWEAICVDDGSTDGCGAILDEYSARDNRVHVIHQENHGVGPTRNVALARAVGDWIVFLDSDDLLHGDALQLINEAIKVGSLASCDVVRYGFTCFSTGDAIDWKKNYDEFSQARKRFSQVDFASYCDTSCINSLVWLNAYSKALVCGMVFKDYHNGEDSVFLTEAIVRAKLMVTIPESLIGYRFGRPGSACTTKTNGRVTFRRVYDDIWSSYDALEILANCKKNHDSSRIHWLAVVMTEGAAYNIMRLAGDDRKRAWQEWYKAVAMTRRNILPILSRYAQIIVILNSILPLHIFACITCALPYYLKQHGIHR